MQKIKLNKSSRTPSLEIEHLVIGQKSGKKILKFLNLIGISPLVKIPDG